MSSRFIAPYINMVDFLADFLGDNTEVVLHDFTDLEHSVVKIRNGHISGRDEGYPATDFVMRILNDPSRTDPYICNYRSAAKNKEHIKSASFFIRDNNNKIVGMLCINSDIEQLIDMQNYIGSIINGINGGFHNGYTGDASENLGQSINEIIDSSIERALAKHSPREEGLSIAEKEEAIAEMNAEGVFLLKGAVSKVAAALSISEPTLYRYLKKAKSAD